LSADPGAPAGDPDNERQSARPDPFNETAPAHRARDDEQAALRIHGDR